MSSESDEIFRRLVRLSSLWSAQNRGKIYVEQQLEKFIIEVTIAYRGIAGDDWTRILSRLVDDRQNSCGCVPCKVILHLDRQLINGVLDRIYVNQINMIHKSDGTVRDPQATLLAKSLGRDLESFVIDNDTGLVGTCALPTPKAFNLRNQRVIAPIRAQSRVPLKGRSVDYRKNSTIEFQGSTGSCHMFSLKSMIEFSDHKLVNEINDMDLLRNFIDVWTDNLGGSLEVALEREVDYLKKLAELKIEFFNHPNHEGDSPAQIEGKWLNSLRNRVRYHGQGSDVLSDFVRIKHRGYVRTGETGDGPPVMRKGLESLGMDLAKKRLNLFYRFGENRTTVEEIKNELRPMLSTLFSMRRANDRLRRPVGADFNALSMEVVTFDKAHIERSENLFLEHLEKYGPLGVSRRSHATTVIGYDAPSGVFYVMDSSDSSPHGYLKIGYQDFFSYLDRYYFIKPTSEAK